MATNGMIHQRCFLTAAALALIALRDAGAQAAGTTLNAAGAESIIAACKSHATAKNQSHGIAVVDAGGHLVAVLRTDGNSPGVMSFAIAKARSAALWRTTTSSLAAGAQATPGFAAAPDVITVAGGVPFFARDGRAVLGAVGTSGEAPADDVACAEAGIRAAGYSLTPAR